ncbi:heme biosynthesis protein HemY [Aliikangiella coralliicola]|uniref:Heme biosynthesis protein HemY n=1 Tax=Aliikangiella coralliicola TaxID=2592383 RepID=A0A545UG15_9GAMM|nr:heme biosynthesis HemY N-terminal domain-containing protein [Aliikangiella coralliicola]TQV88408.1 heme biosynthesis protein HemY [Aliikangiella coralliicola]
MKWKISLIIALTVGALAGSWIKNLPGFVIIAYDKTSYEMRLWIAVCLLLALISALFLIGLFFRSLVAGANKVSSWRGGRRWRRSRKRTIEGMLAFTEGRWKASEDAMVNAAKTSDTKLINYLIAAQAAQQQNAEVRRDAYLRLAHQAEPAAKVAIGLTQAQLQLKHGQYEQALASLNKIKIDNPSHPYVLKLLCRLFNTLQDWEQLYEILPALKKNQVFEAQELQSIEENCVTGLLKKQANQGKIESLRDTWQKLPSAQRKLKALVVCYTKLLIEFDQMDEAETLLRPMIKKQVDAEILALYGNIKTDNPTKQLSFVESWQQTNPNAPREVFLTLGKLAYNSQLWGKARQFLEQALRLKPSAETYLMMAKTLQHLDDEEHAINCFQQGLEFASAPGKKAMMISLPQGSDDLVSAELLPKFQKLEN